MKTDKTCCRYPALSLQQALNESDESWPSRDAHLLLSAEDKTLLAVASTHSFIMERLNKPRQASPCVRTMADLPEVSTALRTFLCTCFCSADI